MGSVGWIEDGIAETEKEAAQELITLASFYEEFTESLMALEWFTDGITEIELEAIRDLGDIAHDHEPIAVRVASLPWLDDSLSEIEAETIDDLARIAYDNKAAAERVLELAWFVDDISVTEADVVQKLRLISQRSGVATERIVQMPFLATIEPADFSALTSLSRMASFRRDTFDGLLSHPALDGGITDDLTPIVAMLYGVSKVNLGLLDTLLDPGKVSLERRSIVTPLSGDVELVIVRTRPGVERSMDLLEHSVRTTEELMDEPLPTRYIGLLYEEAVSGSFAGTNFGTHIAIRPKYDIDDGSHEAEFAPFNIAHEVAHYYWSGNSDWIDEGVAEFMASEVENRRTGRPVVITNEPCPIARSVTELETLSADSDSDPFGCNYSLGERLFVDLHGSMEGTAFWQGLRQLYTKSQFEDAEDDERKGTFTTIEHIREMFEQEPAVVSAVTARWYEGTEPFDLSKLDTGPVDSALPTFNGQIDTAFVSIGSDGTEAVSFSTQDADDRIWLTLKYSYDVIGGPHELTLRISEFYEDGFEYDRRSIEITASDQYIGGTQRLAVGPSQDSQWAPGRYWVYVYEDDRKVAEVQYEVTP